MDGNGWGCRYMVKILVRKCVGVLKVAGTHESTVESNISGAGKLIAWIGLSLKTPRS